MPPQTVQIVPEPPLDRQQVVAAFYKFVALGDLGNIKHTLEKVCAETCVVGTILVAREGVNGTVSGPRAGIQALLAWFEGHNQIAGVPAKFSFAEGPAFHRMKVRLKKEIVTMGQPDVDPNGAVGAYVKPQDWNALISAPDVVVIDTRNDYEVGIGTFEGAIDPQTKSFREFPQWWEENKDRFHNKRVAMFCTGGIRCENLR